MPFTNLSPVEAERLALLMEEAGEVVQACGKILRHGYASHHPDGGPNNRVLLEKEIGDFRAAVNMMLAGGDVDELHIKTAIKRKCAKVGAFLHHQPPGIIAAGGAA